MPTDLEITSFTDAIAAAFGVRGRFKFGHGVALLGSAGQVLDITMFTDKRLHTIDTALNWAACLVGEFEECERLVLFTAYKSGVAGELREADVELLRAARSRFAEHGVLVVDWLQCDGNVVRSIDLASDGEGWRLAAAVT